jgi:hypothetical protein
MKGLKDERQTKNMGIVLVCGSFKNGNCLKRLKYYVEKSVDKKKLVLEERACPFYLNDKCKVNGNIGYYVKGYPDELKTYEKIRGRVIETIEIDRPHLIISVR